MLSRSPNWFLDFPISSLSRTFPNRLLRHPLVPGPSPLCSIQGLPENLVHRSNTGYFRVPHPRLIAWQSDSLNALARLPLNTFYVTVPIRLYWQAGYWLAVIDKRLWQLCHLPIIPYVCSICRDRNWFTDTTSPEPFRRYGFHGLVIMFGHPRVAARVRQQN